MIKAEMLNEMNPKLRALLAAGLIGTAGLGATSCSTSVDDSYDEPPAVEQPEETEETENTVTFKTLGVEEYAENLANAKKQINNSTGEIKTYQYVPITEGKTVYIYRNGSFELASSKDEDAFDDISERGDIIYIRYNESNNRYYVPKDMESDFDTAIAVYKAEYAK